jgi:hypothetical protein
VSEPVASLRLAIELTGDGPQYRIGKGTDLAPDLERFIGQEEVRCERV